MRDDKVMAEEILGTICAECLLEIVSNIGYKGEYVLIDSVRAFVAVVQCRTSDMGSERSDLYFGRRDMNMVDILSAYIGTLNSSEFDILRKSTGLRA